METQSLLHEDHSLWVFRDRPIWVCIVWMLSSLQSQRPMPNGQWHTEVRIGLIHCPGLDKVSFSEAPSYVVAK